MKSKFYLFIGLLCLLRASTSLAAPSSTGGTVDLIPGQSLELWKFVSADPQAKLQDTWSMKDGLLICSGTPLGFLHTARQFTNCHLIVEYRWAPGKKPGNSGIFSRINDPSRPLPRCVEVQLMRGSAGDVLTLQGMAMASGQERFFEVKNHAVGGDIRGVRKLADAEKPAGEWNRVEILAKDAEYMVWVNGQKVNALTGVELRPGFVGLQSEGGEIHFRRLTITALPE